MIYSYNTTSTNVEFVSENQGILDLWENNWFVNKNEFGFDGLQMQVNCAARKC